MSDASVRVERGGVAQAEAVSKTARALNLFRADVLGNLSDRDAHVASERAALALRRLRLVQQTARHVTFLVPLVGPAQVGDWQAVCGRLSDTLATFLRQTSPDWSVVVCCQERPPLPEDPRIAYLPYTDTGTGNDKWRKLRALCDVLPEITQSPGYVMTFDADDLLHPGIVDEMLVRQKPGGYLVRSGYVMDAGTGGIGRADRRGLLSPMRKPFWKLCGSCAALYHDPELPASSAFLAEMTQHEHRMFPYLAALAGQKLHALNRPSVLYVLNHGENFGARRGRVAFKARFVERYKVTDAAELTKVREDFELDG